MSVSTASLASSGIRFSRGVPEPALALDTTLVAARKLLALGPLPPALERALEGGGMRLARTSSLLEAHRALAAQTYDAVLIAAEAEGALDLVKSLKLGAAGASLRSAADRHAFVPFYVLPFSGETEYAVIVRPPLAAYLEDERRVPLWRAILHLDVTRLFGAPGAA